MNAQRCAELAREHYDGGTKDMALDWLISAVEKLSSPQGVPAIDELARRIDALEALAKSPGPQVLMTAQDTAVYAETMKTIALLRAKYGVVAL